MLYEVLGLIFCAILFIWAFTKLLKSIFNLQELCRGRKHPSSVPRTAGMVVNKKTKKLEADSRQILPF